jgi:hypothetical protein
VVGRGKVYLNPKAFAELHEFLGVELPAVVNCDLLGHPESADDILPHETFNRGGGDVDYRLGKPIV